MRESTFSRAVRAASTRSARWFNPLVQPLSNAAMASKGLPLGPWFKFTETQARWGPLSPAPRAWAPPIGTRPAR